MKTTNREWTYTGTMRKIIDRDIDAALTQGTYYGLNMLESKYQFIIAVDYVSGFRGSITFKKMDYWNAGTYTDADKARQAMVSIIAARLKYTDPHNEKEWEYLENTGKKYIKEGGR